MSEDKEKNYGVPQKNRLSLKFKIFMFFFTCCESNHKRIYFIAFHVELSWEKFIIIHLLETFPLYDTGNFISIVAAHLVSTPVMSPEPPPAASFSRRKQSAKAVSPDVGLRPTALPLAHEASLPAATYILSLSGSIRL